MVESRYDSVVMLPYRPAAPSALALRRQSLHRQASSPPQWPPSPAVPAETRTISILNPPPSLLQQPSPASPIEACRTTTMPHPTRGEGIE